MEKHQLLKLETENQELKQELHELKDYKENLLAFLSQIKSAKAFLLWQKYNAIKSNVLHVIRKRFIRTRKERKHSIPKESKTVVKTVRLPVLQKNDSKADNILTHESIRALKINEIQTIEFPKYNKPTVSVVIVVWNKWQYTYQCLKSLYDNTKDIKYEVVIIDNGSSDDTHRMLKKIKNIKIIFNKKNLYFIKACNIGVNKSRGKYIYLLNNDAYVTDGALFSLVNTIESEKKIGVVGSKLIFSDGKLQEAGSMLWSDGSALGYGRGDDPNKEEYCYRREVDFCSGASLLIPRSLYQKVGGMKAEYEPAYYEEVDLCLEIIKSGYKVIYDPKSIIYHYEFTSRTPEHAAQLMATNQAKLIKRWRKFLSTKPQRPDRLNILNNRDKRKVRKVLLILGGNNWEHNDILKVIKLNKLKNEKITVYYQNRSRDQFSTLFNTLRDIKIEVISNQNFTSFMKERRDYFSRILVEPFYYYSFIELLTLEGNSKRFKLGKLLMKQ